MALVLDSAFQDLPPLEVRPLGLVLESDIQDKGESMAKNAWI